MLPSERIITQQYREKNFTEYSSLIQTLKQVEKSHELTVWNSNQRPLGTAPRLKYMQMQRKMVPTERHNLEIPQARANKREPESHVLTSKRGKAFLSQKLIIATRPPATGVVATIMLLRNAGS